MRFVAAFHYEIDEEKTKAISRMASELASGEWPPKDVTVDRVKLDEYCPHPSSAVVATDGTKEDLEVLCDLIRYTLYTDPEFLLDPMEAVQEKGLFSSPPYRLGRQLERFVTCIAGGKAVYDITTDIVTGELPRTDPGWVKRERDEEKSGWHMMWLLSDCRRQMENRFP